MILRETVTLARGQEHVRLARTRLHTGRRRAADRLPGRRVQRRRCEHAAGTVGRRRNLRPKRFPRLGGLFPTLEQAKIDSTDRSQIDVPTDGLAMVMITHAAPPPPPAGDRHVQVLMLFGHSTPTRWGALPLPALGSGTPPTTLDFSVHALQGEGTSSAATVSPH